MDIRSNISNIIKRFDLFGAPLQLTIQSGNKAFQSIYGGITTIIIYGLSAYYFLYLLVQWQMKAILPQVNIQSTLADITETNLSENLFLLHLVNDVPSPEYKQISDRSFLYNTTMMAYGIGMDPMVVVPNNPNYNCQINDLPNQTMFQPLCMNMTDPNQTYFRAALDQSSQFNTYLQYRMTKCKSKQANCITDEKFMDRFQSSLFWEFKTFLQDIDIKDGGIMNYDTAYYYKWMQNVTQIFQIKFTKATVAIDHGFIFPDYSYQDIVYEIDIQRNEEIFNGNFVEININLERLSKTIYLSYPKVTQLMAQAASMLQTLLVVGFLINLLNTRKMGLFIQDQILKIYFPDFTQFQIETNWKGEVINIVDGMGQQMTQNQKIKLMETRKMIIEQLQDKLSIINLVHDVNKLQIAMQHLFPRDYRFQNLSYNLSMLKEQENSSLKASVVLDEYDFIRFFQPRSSTPTASDALERSFKLCKISPQADKDELSNIG